MQRAHKIRLVPSKTQLTLLKKTAGVARYAYNWTLDSWDRQYKEFKEGKRDKKPDAYSLARQWTKERPEWSHEVSTIPQTHAILGVGRAFTNFWKHGAKHPVFKKKGDRASFYMSNCKARTAGRRCYLPMIGWVRIREELRFQGKPMSYAVSCEAEEWYVSVQLELSDTLEYGPAESIVGVDVGIASIAVASDGTALENLRNLARKQRALSRYQRRLARQVKGSNRRSRTRLRIAKIHKKISNQRSDAVHKFTSHLAKNHGTAVVETLDVKRMKERAPKYLRRSMQDTCMAEVHRQLGYKMRELIKAPQFYPSSKTCSNCGNIKADLRLAERVYRCPLCCFRIDRDLNAAINLRNRPWVAGSSHVEPSDGKALKRGAETAAIGG